jgi:hypothetical protein
MIHSKLQLLERDINPLLKFLLEKDLELQNIHLNVIQIY